jgi:hypothetical protein
MLFRSCPVLKRWSHEHEQAFDKFMLYKTRVPVCGAIMLNAACDKVSLMFEYALAKLQAHFTKLVRARQRLEVVVWMGVSERKDQSR